jgi:iron complex transport system ATP-binding protein
MKIDALRRRLYRELSGGERRKVELARLVTQEAPLLLLDEPGSGLDLDWQERLTDLVAELHQKLERTLVMVTHDVPQLPGCCSFALLLKDGMPLAMGAPRDVLTSENFSRLYECEVEVLARDGRFFPLRKAGRL